MIDDTAFYGQVDDRGMINSGTYYLLARARWRDGAGASWAERNPRRAWDVDRLWHDKYGVSRSDVLRSVLGDVSRDCRILEVGASSGAQLDVMAGLGFGRTMCAVDLSREAMGWNPNLRVAADGMALPFRDGEFDMVMSCGMVMHTPPGDIRDAVLRHMIRASSRWVMLTEYWHEMRWFAYHYDGELLPAVWTDHWADALAAVDPTLQVLVDRGLNSLSGSDSPIQTVLARVA